MSYKAAIIAAPPDTISLYVRLSRMAGEKNLSLEGMVADTKALAARFGLRVVGLHVDDGLSGAIRNRPEFVAWLDDARECRASNLGAWHVDRMTREGVNVAALILDAIEGKDPETGSIIRQPVRLLDTKGLDSQGDETSFRFRFVIAAEVARAERERMRDRSRTRMQRAKAAGRFAGGTAPFGTRAVENPDGPGRVLEVEPDEATALHRAGSRLIAGDMSRMAIVRTVNREGFHPRRSAYFTRMGLFQALQSEAAQRLIFTPAENRAIAQALAPGAPGTKRGGRKPSRLLAGGGLRCAPCQRSLWIQRRGERVTNYRCSSFSTGEFCPGPVSVAAESVERFVSEAWLDGWGRLPETEAVRPLDESADRLAEVLNAIDEEGVLVVRARGAERAEALGRLEVLEARRDELEAVPMSALTVLRETGRTYADVWAGGVLDDRRELLLRTAGPLMIGSGRGSGRRFNPERVLDAWRLDPAAADLVFAA